MQISSMAFPLFLLLHAVMMTIDASAKQKHSAIIDFSQWHIPDYNIIASDHTTPQNKVVIMIKPPWEKTTCSKLKQHTIPPNHRLRRKAHFHYKTGQSFQHFRNHHLKSTTQITCNNTYTAKLKTIHSTHVYCQVKQTTQKPKNRLWDKLLLRKIFSFQNGTTNDSLRNQGNQLNNESIEKDAEKTISPMTTQNEDKPNILSTSTHEPTSDTTPSHTNTTHPTTNAPHVTFNSTTTKQTMENHTTRGNHTTISNTTESLKSTEKPEKKLLNWLLHPHISHKHMAHYELEDKYYMSILLVADKSFVKHHSNTDYDTYILTVMNMVADYMRDVTLGVNLELVIARTMYLGGEDRPFESDSEMGLRLENFCDWAQKINPRDTNHPSHHDVAILITRQANQCTLCTCEPLGAAYAGGACVESKSCLLVQDRGLLTAITIAHQLGHLQGMASCLEDEPPKSLLTFPEVLPGVMYDADQQCNMLARGSRACFINSMEFCAKLICRTSTKACYYKGDRPSQGTPCGVNKWCWGGACVRRGWRPLAVSGGWAAWGGWAACSRPCGGGVQRASRACSAPPPHAGGRPCAGDAVRHRTCHTQPCEPNAPSFRALQCSAFNHVPLSGSRYLWRPLPAFAADPCGLYCASGTGVNLRLRPRAADGTPCRPGANDLCIDGVCTMVGCDWVIDSSVSEDRCGVCGGDGMHCHLVQNWYNVTNTTQRGYQLITVIPKGSRKINIFEVCSSTNDLAISNVTTKKEKESYYLIGNKSANAEGEFTILSMRGVHTNAEPGKDFILINGPLPTAIKIFVILQCEHACIHYSYMDIHATAHVDKKNSPNDTDALERRQRNPFLERTNPLHWSRYQWEHLQWGPCSARCQVGTSVCVAHCVSVWFGRVSDSYCAGTKKPRDLVRVCNEQPCRARWQTGQWLECYRGTQWRYVQCMREGRSYSSPPMLVDSSCCRCAQPQSTRRCHEGPFKNCSKDTVVTIMETFITPFYIKMLSAEKRAPSSTYPTNMYITPDIKLNTIQTEKDTQSTENVIMTSRYSTENSIHLQDNTEVPIVSLPIEDIAVNIQMALENSTESNGPYSYSNLIPDNMDSGMYESDGSETATVVYSELKIVEPRIHRNSNKTMKHTKNHLNTSMPLYSGGIIRVLKHTDFVSLESTLVSESTTRKTKTNINLSSLQVNNSKTVLKPKLYAMKKSMLAELKKLIFSKSIVKRDVIKKTHDDLQLVIPEKHLDDKHPATKEISSLVMRHKQTQADVNDSYLILYLRKDCINKIKAIFNEMGAIKIILRDDYQGNINSNNKINKISTSLEDTYGNKIYDFDDVLHSNSLMDLTSCSKVYKKLYTNEFVTKIPLKLLNTVVTRGERINQFTDETYNKERNVWLPVSTVTNESNKNSPSISGKVFSFAKTTGNYFRNLSGEIPNIGKRNETICLDLKRGGIAIQSLYNIVNIYCANTSQINESMTQLSNEMDGEYPAISYSNPWNIIVDKYHTNKSHTGLKLNDSNNYFVDISLSPMTTRNNKRRSGLLKKYKNLFRKHKTLQTDHLRHLRNIPCDLGFKKNQFKKISRSINSQVYMPSQTSSSDFSKYRPTKHQPKTVTPKRKQNKFNFNCRKLHQVERKGATVRAVTKLLASSNKRAADKEVTQDPEQSLNKSISEITTIQSEIVWFSNLQIIKDFMPVDKILNKKVPITGIKCLLNNLTEISNRELGDEIPTLNFGR